MHFDGTNWKQVGDKLAYANGVGVVGNRLYVTGTQEKTIHSYTIEPSGLSNRVDLPALKGADNITFSCGKVITAAHLDFIKFIGHVKKSEKKSPSMVYSVDMKTQELDTLFLDNGYVLSASSTGLIVGDSLYVSQVFDPFIVAVPMSK
jgi:arylesterase/paraoxonase